MTAQTEQRHAVRRFDARPDACPHCDGRVTAGHYRDTGDALECPIDVCPVLFYKRHRLGNQLELVLDEWRGAA